MPGYLPSSLRRTPIDAHWAIVVEAGNPCLSHNFHPSLFGGTLQDPRILNPSTVTSRRHACPSKASLRHAPRPCGFSGPSQCQTRRISGQGKLAVCTGSVPPRNDFPATRLIDRLGGSAGRTHQRLEVLEAESNQPPPRASLEAYLLFMQDPISFADETFFMFLTHVRVQFVIPKGAFTAELAHRVNFDLNASRFLWSVGSDRR